MAKPRPICNASRFFIVSLSGSSAPAVSLPRGELSLAFSCWRLQAPGMEPRKGVVSFYPGSQGTFCTPFLDCDYHEWEVV